MLGTYTLSLENKGFREFFFREDADHACSGASDRLYLVSLSGVPAFRPLYDALSGMGFYNLNPGVIRELQPPDPGELLKRDGSNIASVLANLTVRSPDLKGRIEEYLEKVVPGIEGVDSRSLGPKETLEFRQQVRGAKHPWRVKVRPPCFNIYQAFPSMIQGAMLADAVAIIGGLNVIAGELDR